MKKFKFCVAFTLAEVLITLSIIGVVAALTVPNLMAHYEEQANYVRLKKYQNILSNVYQLVLRDNGDIRSWFIVNNNHTDSVDVLADYFLPHLKYQKKCIDEPGCWIPTVTKTLAKKNLPYANSKGVGTNVISVRMPDGANISINSIGAGEYPGFYGVNNPGLTYGVVFWVDVNGDKVPNTVGLDTFVFVATDKGLVPSGVDNTSNCSRKSSSEYAGASCTNKVLNERGIKY